MTSSMTEWVERALAFTEGLRVFGEGVVQDARVAPPLSRADLDQLNATLRHAVPLPIERFLTTASADCSCKYYLTIRGEMSARVLARYGREQAELSAETNYYGGANLCQAGQFKKWLDYCPEIGQIMGQENSELDELWRQCFPFASTGNDDCLALDLRHGLDDPPVVYLCHDEDRLVPPIAANFESFLAQWERLCHIGPEIWELDDYRNPETRFIDSTVDSAEALRRIFIPPSETAAPQ